jgi:putative redox protein
MPTRVLATFVDPRRMRVEVVNATGRSTALDGLRADGGDESAPSPKETVLAALAACTSMDVAAILRKKRQAVSSYQIAVTGESAREHPKVFTRIVVEHRVEGEVTHEAVRRSVELSATRYCPVSAMLEASVRIEHRYRLSRAGARARSRLVLVTGPGADGAAP